jgi:hypothetical protein
MSHHTPVTVRFGEYCFIEKQNNSGGVCPYCFVIHSKANGEAVEGDCPGLYVRRRKAAFVVMGYAPGRAGIVDHKKVRAGGRNFDRIASAAEKDWYENYVT